LSHSNTSILHHCTTKKGSKKRYFQQFLTRRFFFKVDFSSCAGKGEIGLLVVGPRSSSRYYFNPRPKGVFVILFKTRIQGVFQEETARKTIENGEEGVEGQEIVK
jgi:hypothetical protein